MIEVERLTVRYRGRRAPVTAVDDVSFSVAAGEIVGLLGPNGAGKTSTLKSISSLIHPASGSVRVAGVDVVRTPRVARQQVSLVLEGERHAHWRVTARGNLEYFAALAGFGAREARSVIDNLMDRLRLPNVAVRKLSRGMKQKLVLACALVRQTNVLLLDEPTLGLDVQTSLELRSWIRELATQEGKTILLSSHDMRVVQNVCPRVIVLFKGRCIADERVDALIGALQGARYRFTLSEPIDREARTSLERQFPRLHADGRIIEVELDSSENIYRFIQALRERRAILEGIDRGRTELEDAYSQLVHEN
jgi:ABC-2 type transport system ATP-binding protein